jgi:ABC-type amino acid transport substrate-binding protein
MKILLAAMAIVCSALAAPATAANVSIDLAGAVTGTTVTGVGATFAQRFAGQTVSGIGILGSPTNPLTLLAAGTIDVSFFDPGVSAASNSLLSQPGNAAPLSILLGSDANSFNWTMGSGDGGSVTADFFSLAGALVFTQTFSGLTNYSNFALAGLPTYHGISFKDNTDPGGLRFMNMSYNSVAGVPEPSTWAMMAAGLGVAGLIGARRRKAVAAA